jgi:general secretion pathway protein C
MEVFLKNHFWVFNLVVIALSAGFLASATEHQLEASFLPPETKAPAASHKLAAAPEKPHGKDEAEILKRNIFCSTCPPFAPPEDSDAAGPDGEGGVVKTNLPLRLVATAVSDDEDWSLAFICETQTKECGAFGLDDRIKNAVVTDIDEDRVEFEIVNPGAAKAGKKRGRIEYLELEQPSAQSAPVASTAPVVPAANGEEDFTKGVKKISDSQFQIDRNLLEKVLGDTNLLARSARIVPNVVDGKSNGFKLYAIRPNSIYGVIGLQNGDTVHSINGYDMSSPDKALEVYTKLRHASHLSLTMTRRGVDQTMDYSIR